MRGQRRKWWRHLAGEGNSRALAIESMTDRAVVAERLLARLKVLGGERHRVRLEFVAHRYMMLNSLYNPLFRMAGRAYLASAYRNDRANSKKR